MMTPDPAPSQTKDTSGAKTPDAPAARVFTPRTIGLVALATVAGAVAGALALYGMNGLPGNAPAPQERTAAAGGASTTGADPDCAPAVTHAGTLSSFVKGDIAAFTLATEPRRLPPLSFTDKDGKAVSLEDFRGRTLLVNLWATWCVPCRKEMPALDALQGAVGGPGFEVVAINLDTRDPDKPLAFLKEIGVKHLQYFADPQTKSFQALRAVGRGFGLPTTLLVDAKGCEIGFLAGPAEWSGTDAQALVRAAAGAGERHSDAIAR